MNVFAGPDGQEDMPYLLTAGPVTTARAVRFAMLADYGPHEDMLQASARAVRRELLALANAGSSHECLLLPGPASLAMEAAFGTFFPQKRKKAMVIANGPHATQATQILEALGKPHIKLEYRDGSTPRAEDVARVLKEDATITHVWMSQVDIGTGMLNPVAEIGAAVQASGRVFMLDATLGLGGVAVDAEADHIGVLVGCAECGLESVPGVAFVLARKDLLAAAGEPVSAVLDLRAHAKALQDATWAPISPPSQPLVALREALALLDAEGGVAARSLRYGRMASNLRERLAALGFSLLLKDGDASPMVQTVLAPRAATYDFERFRLLLRQRGFAIDEGMLPSRASFRVGCMGQVPEAALVAFVAAVEDTMQAMELSSLSPAQA